MLCHHNLWGFGDLGESLRLDSIFVGCHYPLHFGYFDLWNLISLVNNVFSTHHALNYHRILCDDVDITDSSEFGCS